MPHKDPDTGIKVMTTLEFFAAEDQAANLEPGTSMVRFYEEMDEDARKEAHRLAESLKAEPNKLLPKILEWYDDDDEDPPIQVMAVQAVRVEYAISKNIFVYVGELALVSSPHKHFRFTYTDYPSTSYFEQDDEDALLEVGDSPFPIREPKPPNGPSITEVMSELLGVNLSERSNDHE